VRIVAYDADEAYGEAALVHAIYAAEYPPGPEFARWRDGLWARHRARPGFDLLVAYSGDSVAGVAWAYIGDRGQYWSDAVAASLPEDVGAAWVGGHLEVVELIVLPSFRRQGIGRALLTTLMSRSSAEVAMLSVRDTALAALRLYRSSGWQLLGKLGPAMTIMGLSRKAGDL
jgi:ribosomal protein S18 acetylase RimI-like enzyme